MCGEGLTETDGEDYRISDCKADKHLVGEGLISELQIHHLYFTLEKRRKNHLSFNQDNNHFLYLHRPHHAEESLSCTHLLLLHLPNAVRFSDSLLCWKTWNVSISSSSRPTHGALLAFLVLKIFSDSTIWVEAIPPIPCPRKSEPLSPLGRANPAKWVFNGSRSPYQSVSDLHQGQN